ncbi:MAG TPA: helix-turn-helix transcriptional regulator [Candidatus Avoscillospira avistercoris]|uniref:Helix-turn-helix transcriptional regulator n=1 Tax=Candidatus Avoscillospira avistercoris TaxID=2840707 RepID=A0A9D1JT81_9FIRM|nr:helix-turn-helix transcriptional regulator [Candidatus Avoscillospira avistercoris]
MKRQVQPLVFDGNIYNTIRRNIKRYRQEKGLTAAELAEMIGRSHDFMRQIESEKVGYNFSLDTFYRISVALDVSMDELAEQTKKREK